MPRLWIAPYFATATYSIADVYGPQATTLVTAKAFSTTSAGVSSPALFWKGLHSSHESNVDDQTAINPPPAVAIVLGGESGTRTRDFHLMRVLPCHWAISLWQKAGAERCDDASRGLSCPLCGTGRRGGDCDPLATHYHK